MIKVNFIEPATPEWADWKQRCLDKIAELQAAYGRGDDLAFESKLYSEMKAEMKKQFHGKCAYCEELIDGNQHVDVEHFRPKGAVTDMNHQRVTVAGPGGVARPHPGYFWLAYDWKNLLPSCVLCNQPSSDGSQKLGKRNRFPLKPASTHALSSGQIASEAPLLLNPMWDDPSPHFKFDSATGRVIGLTDEGRACVEVFGLNTRERLMGQRRQVYESVMLQAKSAVDAHLEDNAKTFAKQRASMSMHKNGEAEFALAGRQALADHRQALLDYLNG